MSFSIADSGSGDGATRCQASNAGGRIDAATTSTCRSINWAGLSWYAQPNRFASARAVEGGLLPALLEQFRHQPRPAGLMAGADAGASVAVEVLVEEDQVAPVRIA